MNHALFPPLSTSTWLAALLLLAPLMLILSGCSPEPEAASTRGEARTSLPVRAYIVAPRTLERRLQVSAPVVALRSIDVAARTEGVVSEVLVEEGDRVEAGHLMARIDVSEQRAELARAEASLREARASFSRISRLRERDYIDDASFLAAESALDVAASVVQLWQTRVAFGRIEAPSAGHVIQRWVEPGASIGRLETAFALADLDQLVVRVGVSELDVRELAVGAEVLVSFDALDQAQPFAARIRRIFPAADGASRLVTVEIELPDASLRGVRPGYLARAELLVDQRHDVLAVPAGSVGQGESSFVMVITEDMRLVKRAVTTGIIRGNWREITGGLHSGERIVSSNPLDLAEGDLVRVVEMLEGDA